MRLIAAVLFAFGLLAGCRHAAEVSPASEPEWVREALQSELPAEQPDPVPVKAAQDPPPPMPVPPTPAPGKSEKPDPAPVGPPISPTFPWKAIENTASLLQSLTPPAIPAGPIAPPEPDAPAPPPADRESAAVLKPVPQPVDLPAAKPPRVAPDQPPRIALDPAYVATQARVSSGPAGVKLVVFTATWCVFCNGDAIKAAAADSGMADRVQVLDVDRDRAAVRPFGSIGSLPAYVVADFSAIGPPRVLWKTNGRQEWPALSQTLERFLPPEPVQVGPVVGAIKAGTIPGGKPIAEKVLALAKALLGPNGSVAITYTKPGAKGYIRFDELGTPIQFHSQTTLKWQTSGDTLTVSLNPPVKARVLPLYWVLLDHVTLSADRLDASILRAPDVYLPLE